jgi:hypothetical protein
MKKRELFLLRTAQTVSFLLGILVLVATVYAMMQLAHDNVNAGASHEV